MVRGVLLVVLRAENHLMAVLLTPLDQAALEIRLRLGEILEVQVAEIDPPDQQAVDEFVALVEVDGAHHGLEGISVDVFLHHPGAVGDHVAVEADMHGQGVERLARDDLRAQLGHEPFVAVGEFDEEVVRSDGFDDGVAEVFEAFVVDRPAVVQNQRS